MNGPGRLKQGTGKYRVKAQEEWSVLFFPIGQPPVAWRRMTRAQARLLFARLLRNIMRDRARTKVKEEQTGEPVNLMCMLFNRTHITSREDEQLYFRAGGCLPAIGLVKAEGRYHGPYDFLLRKIGKVLLRQQPELFAVADQLAALEEKGKVKLKRRSGGRGKTANRGGVIPRRVGLAVTPPVRTGSKVQRPGEAAKGSGLGEPAREDVRAVPRQPGGDAGQRPGGHTGRGR